MGHVQFLEPLILEVALDGIKFGHTVADRRSGGEHNAPAAGDLREILSSVFVNFLQNLITFTPNTEHNHKSVLPSFPEIWTTKHTLPQN